MFKNETKNAMMAMAVVAMFMLSACAVFFADNSDATEYESGQQYQIYMKVGDTFSYAPDANLTGTTFSWTVDSKPSTESASSFVYNSTAAVAGSTTKLEFTPTKSGDSQVTLTANWSANGQSQDATQILKFKVYDKITFDSSDVTVTDSESAVSASASVNLLEGLSAGKTYTFTVSGGDTSLALGAPTVTSTGTDSAAPVVTAANASGNLSCTVTVPTTIKAGTYTISMPASFSVNSGLTQQNSNTTSQNKTLTFTINVDSGMTLGNISDAYAVAGQGGNRTIALTSDTISTASIDYDLAYTGETGLKTVSPAKGSSYVDAITSAGDGTKTLTLTLPTATIVNTDFNNDVQLATVSFTVTATADKSDDSTVQITTSKAYTLNIYRNLKFTTTPLVDSTKTNAQPAIGNGLDVILSTVIDGANKITYNWGDGTEFSQNIYSATQTFHSANHTYAKAGTYFIQITAKNDFGETSYITPYTTGAFIGFTNADKTLKMTGIDSKVDGDNLTLTGKAIVTDGVTTSYKWTYTSGDVKDKVITNEDKPAWVVSVSGKTLVLSKADVPDNTKFVCEVSATFEGDTEATTSSASYIYNDANFFSQNPWALWIPIIVAAVLLVVMLFVTGFVPPMVIATGIAVLAQIVMLALRFFSVI